MSVNKVIVAYLLACLFIFGCVTTAPIDRLESSATKAIAPSGAIEENTTDFNDVLSCVGAQVAAYGSKQFYVGNDRINNETGVKDGIPDSARTMLQSAFGILVEKSAGKIVWSGFGSGMENSVIASFINENVNAKKLKSFDTPEYIISGAISQFEKDAQKATRDADLKVYSSGLGNSEGANISVLGTNLTLLSALSGNYAMYKGIQSNNILKIMSVDSSSGLMLGYAKIGGVGLNVAMQKKEGISAALMQLMQLGAAEITGKFYRDDFDYRQCLDKDERKNILANLAGNIGDHVAMGKNALIKPLGISMTSNSEDGYFKNGEVVKLTVTSNENGYLNCFYSMDNGKSVKIYPNKYAHESLIQDRHVISVPGDDRIKITAERASSGKQKERVTCLFSRVNPSSVLNSMIGTIPTDKYCVDDVIRSVGSVVPENSLVSSMIELKVR